MMPRASQLNPFIWDRPIEDPSKIVGMEPFAHEVALMLKGQTNVAIFGARDTGKTTFINQLGIELAKEHGPDAPPFDVININLQRVVSVPGFIGCVHDAVTRHPSRRLRRAAQRQLTILEKEIGFDIKVVRGSVKRGARTSSADETELLHAQLSCLRSLSDHVVVVFDEFQRLRHCPGAPLDAIRSALMSTGAGHVSLVFTGSIRNALKMMLEHSEQPLFGEAAHRQLPVIARVDFAEYLDFQFEATGKPADDTAVDRLLDATRSHPRGTQQLAWECWQATPAGQPVTVDCVIDCHERLVHTIERSEYAAALNILLNGDEGEVNEVRALQLLADQGGANVTGRALASRYGFSSHSKVVPALERLRGRGLVERRDDDAGAWFVVDPLFEEWLRRFSPLVERRESPADLDE